VYRLRGTAVKALRALILLEFFHRFIFSNDVDRKIEKLKAQLAEIESEAKELRRKIARLERDRPDSSEAISDDSQLADLQDEVA
jgi:hypothetical protein